MAFHSYELQASVYAKLTSTASVNNLVGGRIYDDVPQGTAYPFIQIGEESIIDNSTKTLQGQSITVNVHVFSEYRGKLEVKNILSAIYDALHDSDMIVDEANLINFRFEFSDIVVESDGITRHGVMRFRAIVYDQ